MKRFTPDEMRDLAARAIGKVDAWPGGRGLSMVTTDEIAAMCGLLVDAGLAPIYPDPPAPGAIDAPLRPLKGPGDV